MRFGEIPVGEAEGSILAHSIRRGALSLKKGTRLDAARLAELRAEGIDKVIAARLDPGDVHEDVAADRLARASAGEGVRVEGAFTGRSNLYSEVGGLALIDRDLIDRINRIDPSITVATLPEYAVVEPGRMIGTVKIIPFAVSGPKLAEALAIAKGAIRVAAFRPFRVGLVATTLPSLKLSVMEKTRRLLEERLARSGASLLDERRVSHDAGAVASALRQEKAEGADLLIAFGASATVDRADVVPAAIELAGGRLVHFGMPVDPGNLLVLGEIEGIPVIGAPGCARSPKENGFDWILNRLLAGLKVTPDDIAGLGTGGLLMEIVSRPQPRAGGESEADEATDLPRIAALILAAGQSRRMRGPNKLVATIDGKPLVRIAAEAALRSRAGPVVVVTGHEPQKVRAALAGLDVRLVENPDFASGLSTSLRTGIAALPGGIDGAVIMLADMPGITGASIDRLVDAFDPLAGALIVVPTSDGKRGNPVLWSSRYFSELASVQGDTGGRHLIGANQDSVVEVEVGREVLADIDTTEALATAGGRLPALVK